MRSQRHTKQFRKDLERLARRKGSTVLEFIEVATMLLADEPLLPRHKDHQLKGNYIGYRDCHVRDDLVLIYKKTPGEILFVRIGTHSDLF